MKKITSKSLVYSLGEQIEQKETPVRKKTILYNARYRTKENTNGKTSKQNLKDI